MSELKVYWSVEQRIIIILSTKENEKPLDICESRKNWQL